MKYLNEVVCVTIGMLLVGCAITKTEFRPIHKFTLEQKSPELVEVMYLKPGRLALCVGMIGTNGNGFASHANAEWEARKKAASLGADFIMVENSGAETATYINPGFSTYSSNGSAFVSGNGRSLLGSASQTTTAYSQGPSVSTVVKPWAVFSAWVYRPSSSGITQEDNIITGFNLRSKAEESGIQIGDKIIGIDGFDMTDDALAQHLMRVFPGDKMIYSILRDGKRIDISVEAIKN